jgi:hypothetical protein
MTKVLLFRSNCKLVYPSLHLKTFQHSMSYLINFQKRDFETSMMKWKEYSCLWQCLILFDCCGKVIHAKAIVRSLVSSNTSSETAAMLIYATELRLRAFYIGSAIVICFISSNACAHPCKETVRSLLMLYKSNPGPLNSVNLIPAFIEVLTTVREQRKTNSH